MRRGAIGVLCLIAAAVLQTAELEAQCAMCRTLLATPEGQRVAGALRSGIWILLAAPFSAFAVVAIAAVRSQRRLRALREGPAPLPPAAE